MIEFAVAALPLFLLLAALLVGRYPGCEAAMRLADRLTSHARPRVTQDRSWRRPRPLAVRAPRGGLLIAFSLAQRPPPLAA